MTVNMMDEFGFGGGGDSEMMTGTYPTILKFNAKEKPGTFSTYDKDEEGMGVWTPVEFPKKIVMDMNNFKKGYFAFSEDNKPVRVFVRWDEAMPAQPAGLKPAFEVNMFSSKLDFVVFGSTSICCIRSMQKLLSDWQSSRPEDETKVPVCTMRVETISTKHGVVYTPYFDIEKYVDRPIQLMGEPHQHPADSPKSAAVKPEPKVEEKPPYPPMPVEKPSKKKGPKRDEFNDDFPPEMGGSPEVDDNEF
tara:strand:+ start:2331 stop:3074 length:744 start_codon:yes stop_codon:yes gene_type:complete